MGISVIINTLNEEKNIARVMKSVSFAQEIIVCDMFSEDKTVEIAKKLGAKIYKHKKTGYVEPARNFAISKAIHDWVLIVDADEEIPLTLAKKIEQITTDTAETHFFIPRKNVIFGKWVHASQWWPDYNIRLFRKGSVKWQDKIHSRPQTSGKGQYLEAKEQFAIIHHHYENVDQYFLRMMRYSDVQAMELIGEGYKFRWQDLIQKPISEFLGRFFVNQGYRDGVHGFVLSMLQAVSFLLVYIRVWEKLNFKYEYIPLKDLKQETDKAGFEIKYWFRQSLLSKNKLIRLIQKSLHKIS